MLVFELYDFILRAQESALSNGFRGGIDALLAYMLSNVPYSSFDYRVFSIKISWIYTSLNKKVGFKSSEYEISSGSEATLYPLFDDNGGLKPESEV